MADNEKLEKTEAAQTKADADKATAKKDKAEKKPEKKKKPSVFARIKQWWKETRAELKKVQWPTWKQTLNNTLIVVAFCIVVGLCIFLFDKLAEGIFTALINLFHG